MKLRIYLIALLLAAAPVTLLAQQGPEQGPEQGKRHDRSHGPVDKLIRHREAMGLTEEQVSRLKEIKARLEETNGPFVRRLMTIRRELLGERPYVHPRDMTPAQRTELQPYLDQARPLLEAIDRNNRAAMREVGEVLTTEQKARLREMLRKKWERDGRPEDERQRSSRGPGG